MGKWIGFAVLVLAVAAGTVAIALRTTREPLRLRKRAEAVLKRISDGKLEAVYGGAAPEFRERVSFRNFNDTAGAMNRSLGRFRKILGTVQTQSSSGSAGRAARFVGMFRFARAATQGELSFRRIGGRWRLLGIDIDIPKSLNAKTAPAPLAPAPHGAPPKALQAVKNILAHIRSGDAAAIYRDASAAFRTSRDEAAFGQFLASRERALGKLTGMLDVTSSSESADQTRVDVQVALAFERARTRGSFELVKVDGDWKLLTLRVVVPSGRLPDRKPDPRPQRR